MKETIRKMLTILVSSDNMELTRRGAILLGIVSAILMFLLLLSSCSTQYVHSMSYSDGQQTVTIECQTNALTEKK